MEQTPSSSRSPELPSVSPPSSGELVGQDNSPERQIGNLNERQERQGEAVPAVEQSTPPPVVPFDPAVPPPATDNTAVTQPVTDPPAVANDDELIEKEWVDKAKKIITATKDDPYKREQEVSRLQADYLQKRYGRSIGSLQ